MKHILTIVFLACLTCPSFGQAGANQPMGSTTYGELVAAINQVEAGGRHANVPDGDSGLAIGPFQIHRDYWQDAVDYDQSIGGNYGDCRNYNYALKVVNAYLRRYAKKYIASENWEAVARIHNGGPNGYKHKSTVAYWLRVKQCL